MSIGQSYKAEKGHTVCTVCPFDFPSWNFQAKMAIFAKKYSLENTVANEKTK
jgi:hypothetical protein